MSGSTMSSYITFNWLKNIYDHNPKFYNWTGDEAYVSGERETRNHLFLNLLLKSRVQDKINTLKVMWYYY